MAGFLGQIAQSAGAAAGAGGTGGGGDLGSFMTSAASNFLQPFFDNYYQDQTTGNRAENYNKYADMTYPEDSRRMLNRMDTLYPGTTPWERLGIQPASSPSLPDSKAPGSAPFLLAQMQQDTALKTTEMNNTTAKEIANINAGVSTANTKLTTDTTLEAQARQQLYDRPEQAGRLALNAAEVLLKNANTGKVADERANLRASTRNTDVNTDRTKQMTPHDVRNAEATTNRIYSDIELSALSTVLQFMPRSTFTAGGFSTTTIEGIERLQQQPTSSHGGMRFQDFFNALAPDEAYRLFNFGVKSAGALREAARTAGDVGDARNSFLGKPMRPHTTTGDRAFYNRDGEVMGGVTTTTTTR